MVGGVSQKEKVGGGSQPAEQSAGPLTSEDDDGR